MKDCKKFRKALDFAEERRILDREITFFHFKRAQRRINKNIAVARKMNDRFFFFYFLAQQRIVSEDYAGALKCLERALSLRPKDGPSFNDYALCLADMGKYKEALEYFNEGIQNAPDYASLYHNKGWLLNSMRHYKEAVLLFKKTLELEPRRPEALYSLADTYVQLKNLTQAQKYFRMAFKQLKGKCSYMRKETQTRLEKLKTL